MGNRTSFIKVVLLTLIIAIASFAGKKTTSSDFSGYIEVTNSTGYSIYYLYISHDDASGWEDDVLGDDVLSDGESVRIDLDNYPSAIFDVRAEDEDGDTYTIWGIDVEYNDLELTLSDLD